MPNKVIVKNEVRWYTSDELNQGWIVQDSDGDIHVVTEDLTLVELASGVIFTDTGAYAPFLKLAEVTIKSE